MKPIWKFFVSILILTSSIAYSSTWPVAVCGSPPYDEGYYFPVIDQKIIKDASLHPFLNCPYKPYCDSQISDLSLSENIADWQHFFGGAISDEVIYQLVYTESVDWYSMLEAQDLRVIGGNLARHIPEELQEAFGRYMVLAKQCEGISSNLEGSNYGWYQGESRHDVKDNKPELLKLALLEYHKETNAFLKNRYGYQIVRLAHYLQENEMALRYFNEFLELDPATPYIYYLALEQRSGAAFNLSHKVEAAEGFLEVYTNAPSRREVSALSLKYMNWADAEFGPDFFDKNGHREVFSFFKAFHLKASIVREMQNLQKENPNSAYLEVLAMREIDDLQNKLFIIEYFGAKIGIKSRWEVEETDTENLKQLQQIAKAQILDAEVVRKDFWQIILSATYLRDKNYAKAAKQLTNVKSTSELYEEVERFAFGIEVLQLESIDRQQINKLFVRLKSKPQLHNYSGVTSFFLNTVANLYEADGNNVLSHIGRIYQRLDYGGVLQEFTSWDIIEAGIGTNWQLAQKNAYVKEEVISKLQAFVDLPDKTAYESLLGSKLNSSPEDYLNELRGTWHFQKNELEEAIVYFKKIQNPSAFYGEYLRPEMFSGAIKERFDLSFAEQSDAIHLQYKSLFSEHLSKERHEDYPDNKLKLAEFLLNLESLAVAEPHNASDYYYMLGNAWYNMSLPGWFVNSLHYEGNDSRNRLSNQTIFFSSKKGDQITPNSFRDDKEYRENISSYFKKALASDGSRETKAKATYMLAKTNYCYTEVGSRYYKNRVEVCGEHKKYFNSLHEDYADTNFQLQVIKECSWYRTYLGLGI